MGKELVELLERPSLPNPGGKTAVEDLATAIASLSTSDHEDSRPELCPYTCHWPELEEQSLIQAKIKHARQTTPLSSILYSANHQARS